jgi:hypothetical protein
MKPASLLRMLLIFGTMKHPLLYVTNAKGKVLAVQVAIEDWIALLEKVCALQASLWPKGKLDNRLDALAQKRVGHKKKMELDDIGFIGTGRVITEEETMLISAHIQANKAKMAMPMSSTTKRKSRTKV